MRVLITGHMGYIGPVMVRAFRRAGHFVGGLDTGFFREHLTTDDDAKVDVEHVKDTRAIDASDLADFDCVVHLAALSNDPLGELTPALTLQINHEATVRLALKAREAGIRRFLFASSCSLYGAAGTDRPLSEEAPLNPVSAYAVSKVKSELALRELADEKFSPVFLRNATAFGVSPGMRFDLVLNNLMGWAKTAGRIRVTSDGTPWRPLVHVEDIAHAALCAAQAPREAIHNEAFNIGRNDNNYRIREIAAAVAREVSGASLEITGETGGDLRSYRVSFEKALGRLPGYAPTWTVERGCHELAEWFDHRNETPDSFQSRRYVRLKQLKYLLSDRQLSDTLTWRRGSAAEREGLLEGASSH